MASNYFTISPTSGSGNGTIRVTPVGNNNTTEERKAIVSINGQSVTITQYGIPCISGSTSISAPATGNTYQIEVHTRYDVQFRYKPDWITIDDGQGNYISSAQTISSSVANGKTYNLTISPNASNDSRSTSNFGMYHYLHSNLQTDYVPISVSQAAGAEDYITIISTSALDWDDTNAKVINIQANVPYTTSNSNTTDFTLNGGNGYVTIRANDTNTGQTLKTTTISVVSTKASFPFTATCVVTQYRQPRINVIGSGTVPNSGGTKYIEITSDYYWWISPTVQPDTNAYYEYISMSAKTADANMAPVPSGHTYSLDWTANNGVYQRNGSLYVGYLKLDNSTTARSSQSVMFEQDTMNSDTFIVSPTRIPETGYASSGGGVYQVQVTTSRAWGLNNNPTCVVSPSSGTGSAVVTITIPPATRSGSSYHWVENIVFVTRDGGLIASESVSVWQGDAYVPSSAITLNHYAFTFSSASVAGQVVEVTSPVYNWVATIDCNWIDAVGAYTGGTGTTYWQFDVLPNGGADRVGHIIFSANGVSSAATIEVTQSGLPAYIIVDPDYFELSSGTSIHTFSVSANTSWSASIGEDDWIDLTTTTGNSGYTTGIHFEVTQNTGAQRDGAIRFSAGTTYETLNIRQASGATPVIPDLITLSSNAGSVSSAGSVTTQINVTASGNWTLSNNVDWLKWYGGMFDLTPITSGTSGTTTIFRRVDANSGSSRTGTTTFTCGTASTTYTLTQAEAYTAVTYDDIVIEPEDDLTAIPATGGVFSINVENDGANAVDWEINYDGEIDEWATILECPNTGSCDTMYDLAAGNMGYVYLYVQPNDGSLRQGTISIAPMEGSPQLQPHTLTIRQFGE